MEYFLSVCAQELLCCGDGSNFVADVYLLLGTDVDLNAMGFELRFSSRANFATYFVRYKGITPVQFRRAGREK